MARNNRRRVLTLACAAIMAPALGRRAFADAWPKDKIIRAEVTYAAGRARARGNGGATATRVDRFGEMPRRHRVRACIFARGA
jgi:hypothetical protein